MPPTGAARGSLPFDAVTLKGLLHITSVIRPWNPPHLTRRITHVMCPGDIAGRTRQCGGGHNSPFPAAFLRGPRRPWQLPAAARFPLQCRSASSAGSAASSREPVQLRCRGSWSEGSGEPLSECVPGLHGGRAAGDDRAETPGPLLRRRSCVGGVPGQPVPAAGLSERRRGSHAGGAGWGGSTVHSCRCPCPPRRCDRGSTYPMGQPLAACCCLRGAPRRASQRCRTWQRAAHPAQKGRQSAAAEWCGGGPCGGRPADARPEGDPLLSVKQPFLTSPTASAGGCRGGVPFSRVHGQE